MFPGQFRPPDTKSCLIGQFSEIRSRIELWSPFNDVHLTKSRNFTIIHWIIYLLLHTGNLSEYIPFLHIIRSVPKMVKPGLHWIFQTLTEWWASVINETFPLATWWGAHSSKRKKLWFMKMYHKFKKIVCCYQPRLKYLFQ